MRLEIDDIPRDGRQVRFDRGTAWALAAAVAALEGEVSALQGTLDVTRGVRRQVTVQAEACATARTRCDRCGREVDLDVAGAESLRFVPTEGLAERAGQEVRLQTQELDLGFHDGVAIDLADAVSELLALARPMRVTCEDPEVHPMGDGPPDACGAAAEAASNPDPSKPSKGHPAFEALRELL